MLSPRTPARSSTGTAVSATTAVGAPLVTIASEAGRPTLRPEVPPSGSLDLQTPRQGEGSGPLPGRLRCHRREAATRRRRRVGAPKPHCTECPEAGPPGEPVKPVRHGGLEVGRAAEAKFAGNGASTVTARAKPPVRRLAKQLGIDLSGPRPTGRDGTVTRDDVESAASLQLAGSGSTDAGGVVGGVIAVEPVRGVNALDGGGHDRERSHYFRRWLSGSRLMSAAVRRWSIGMRGCRSTPSSKVTPLLLVAAACLTACAASRGSTPCSTPPRKRSLTRGAVQLGVAVASDRGLVVPHVGDAASLTLHELAVALGDVVSRARAGTATPADLVGGTFTITNVGVFGIDGGTPMITPGQSAILAFGAWRDKPWVERGQVVVRTTSTLSLSFDHRFIHGATGSRFLRDVADVLEEPALLHLWT